jgi:hypothetical protein
MLGQGRQAGSSFSEEKEAKRRLSMNEEGPQSLFENSLG